ncbi:MAG: SLC13 family permease [Veillonellaceae bacterium]|nr:SLC13 family permease [Veillonellaceae bacterium]
MLSERIIEFVNAVTITLCFLGFAVVMFVWEKIPLSVTAMIVAVGLVVTGVLSPKEAFSGFVDTNVLLFMAMFIVGAAFFETGMAQAVGSIVTKCAKTERMLIIAVMVITGIMSGFLSNTGTAAVLIPVAIGIAQKAGFNQSKFLMPLVLASAMGGNLSLIGASCAYATPIGMPANTMVYNIAGYSFMDYVKVGLPLMVVSTIVSLILLPIFFPFYP